VFLANKEKELSQLVSERQAKNKEADDLSGRVEKQKERKDPGWFERRAIEKDLGRLRTLLESIEPLTARERDVRNEAFTCASAIVLVLEGALERLLADLQDRQKRKLVGEGDVERIRALEKERRLFQGKVNALMPEIPLPAELPKGVAMSQAMIEDQRRNYEASIARLVDGRAQAVQERRLEDIREDTLPEASVDKAAKRARHDAKITEFGGKIRSYQEKLRRLPVSASRMEM
jgi:hypothetical protein